MIQGNKQDILKQLQTLLEDGKYYSIDVEEPGKPRTKGQTDRFYKVCRNLSEATGYTMEEIKTILIYDTFGKDKKVTDMTTQEMSWLIDRGQQRLAEVGVYDEI